MENPTEVHYQRPGWFTRHVFNNAVSLLTKAGIGVWGARTLEVRGRKTGLPRRTPVNLLQVEERHYLVAARGEVEWGAQRPRRGRPADAGSGPAAAGVAGH